MFFKVTALPTNDKFGRAITIEREINKECKQLIQKNKQRRLRALLLQGAIDKSLMLLLQYGKKLKLDNTLKGLSTN